MELYIVNLLLVLETTTHKEIPKKKGKKGKKRRGKQRDNSDDDTPGLSRPQVDTTAELPEVSQYCLHCKLRVSFR